MANVRNHEGNAIRGRAGVSASGGDPTGHTLIPMLIAGLVLIVLGGVGVMMFV